MFWSRIFLGVVGLFCAFSAGGKLQLWIDEGKVWHKPRNGFSRLLSYDQEPFSYVTEIGFYILVMLGGLLFVWLALGGGFGRFTRK